MKSNDYDKESGKCSAIIRSCFTHVQYVSATIHVRMAVKYVQVAILFEWIVKCGCLCLSEWPPMTEVYGGWMWSCVAHTLGSRFRVSFRIWFSFLFVWSGLWCESPRDDPILHPAACITYYVSERKLIFLFLFFLFPSPSSSILRSPPAVSSPPYDQSPSLPLLTLLTRTIPYHPPVFTTY